MMDDFVDQRAFDESEGAGPHGGARVVLAGGDHGHGETFVTAEAGAITGADFDIAPGGGADRAHPGGKLPEKDDFARRRNVSRTPIATVFNRRRQASFVSKNRIE